MSIVREFVEIQTMINDFSFNISEEHILESLKDPVRWRSVTEPNCWGQNCDSTGDVEYINKVDGKCSEGLYNQRGWLIYSQFLKKYNEGYTFILSNVQRLNRELRTFTNIIEDKLGSEIFINCYFSKGLQKPSFEPHTDIENIAIKNLYGVSHWVLNEQNFILGNQDCLSFLLLLQDLLYQICVLKVD